MVMGRIFCVGLRYWRIGVGLDAAASGTVADTAQETAEDGEDWEWEYVDENGNEIPAGEDEDWEWEYVEDDGEEDKPDNNKQ